MEPKPHDPKTHHKNGPALLAVPFEEIERCSVF